MKQQFKIIIAVIIVIFIGLGIQSKGFTDNKDILLILTTIVWPITSLLLIIIFKKEVGDFLKKAKKNIDDLDNVDSKHSNARKDDIINIDSKHPNDRIDDIINDTSNINNLLIKDIQTVNKQLDGLHPISLYILIELGFGTISSSTWIKLKPYILKLKNRGLIHVNSDINILYTNQFIASDKIELSLTKNGNLFLDKIGFRRR